MTGYIFLLLTVISEVSGTTLMKLSEGFTRPVYAAGALIVYLCTLTFMTMALKTLKISLVYATWSGAGLVIVTVIGLMFFNEEISWIKVLFLAMIVTGVAGINLMKAA